MPAKLIVFEYHYLAPGAEEPCAPPLLLEEKLPVVFGI